MRWGKLRRWASGALLGISCLPMACSHLSPRTDPEFGPMRVGAESPVDAPMGVPMAALPQPEPVAGEAAEVVRATAESPDTASKNALPISLDTVLRLAEDQNPQIRLARAKVGVAFAERGGCQEPLATGSFCRCRILAAFRRHPIARGAAHHERYRRLLQLASVECGV